MENTTNYGYSSLETQQAFGLLPEIDQNALVEIHHDRANIDNMLITADNNRIVSDICSGTQEKTGNIMSHSRISYEWRKYTIKTKTGMLLSGYAPKAKMTPIVEFNFSHS